MDILKINKRVAEIEGLSFEVAEKSTSLNDPTVKYIRAEMRCQCGRCGRCQSGDVFFYDFSPADNWSLGGPIIEKYFVAVKPDEKKKYVATIGSTSVISDTFLKSAMLAIIEASDK